MKVIWTLMLSLSVLLSAPVWADPDKNESGNYLNANPYWTTDYWTESEREALRHYEEMEREARKHREEIWRERCRREEELVRESRKRQAELRRERRQRYEEREREALQRDWEPLRKRPRAYAGEARRWP